SLRCSSLRAAPLFPYTTLFRSISAPWGREADAAFPSACSSTVEVREVRALNFRGRYFPQIRLFANSRGGSWCCAGVLDSWISSRSEEHTSELQSRENIVCRLLL